MVTMTAAVAARPGTEFDLLEIELEEPRDDEVLVRVLATGICHTDLNALSGRLPVTMPIVLGHEGAGVVERVGERVTTVRPGDRVVIVPDFCGACDECRQGRTSYCLKSGQLVFGGVRLDGSAKAAHDGDPVRAGFFGQSSFAPYSLVTERNIIPAAEDAPLEHLCALTCGTSAGAGAMLNTLKPEPHHAVAVFGVGTVGLMAVAAARLRGARRIIAVDVHRSRLDMALELGATDVVQAGPGVDTVAALSELAPRGIDRAFDSTGVKDVMLAAIYSLGMHGEFGYVTGTGGVPLDLELDRLLTRGVTIRGIMGGDGTGGLFHRELIDLYQRGALPIDRLVRTYPFESINEAVADMRSGVAIKPVLVFGER
ncbi:NAD(P)-dependent alcohol dehydrogenase [Microbacterium sp. NPDC096154]|uniref:NAD(P)-dependent alcohol dehydrogenase n=1 Tax=Microbacterium sp. NPDC096154 TaxID=3155549 RepID=UPI00331E7B49